MRNIKILTLLFIGLLTLSCQGEDGPGGVEPPKPEVSEQCDLAIDLADDQWVYVSLVNAVGTSNFNDEDEDAQWAKRKDWDVAFCNGYIRVNSGSSGTGDAGILVSEDDFEQITSAPTQGYNEDFVQH